MRRAVPSAHRRISACPHGSFPVRLSSEMPPVPHHSSLTHPRRRGLQSPLSSPRRLRRGIPLRRPDSAGCPPPVCGSRVLLLLLGIPKLFLPSPPDSPPQSGLDGPLALLARVVGHPIQSLPDLRRTDARSAQIGGSDPISQCFQVSAYSREPIPPIL